MCGYCIEGGLILSFVESEKFDKPVEMENNWATSYLQEGKELAETINKTRYFDDFSHSIDICFCRVYDECIEHGYDDFYKLIASVFNKSDIHKYFTERNDCCDSTIWNQLGNAKLYKDKQYWEKFISNKNQLIEESEKALNSYCKWWLSGGNKTSSDPAQRMKETGIMDPIENTTPEDWKKFYSIFPTLYFSLSYLSKHRSRSKAIKCLALTDLHDTPDFLGYDLWLQRKAFTACVKEYGSQFIFDHFENIRHELIFYSLLKVDFTFDDLDKLKELVLSGGHFDCMDPESILELIEKLKLQLKHRVDVTD